VRNELCREVNKLVKCIGYADVEAASKSDQVAKVHGLDRRGSRSLTSELVSASRIAGISNDEHGPFLAGGTSLCGSAPLLVRVRGV